MTIKFKCYVGTNRSGSEITEEVELEFADDATTEQIEAEKEAYAREWYHDQISWGTRDIE